MTHLGSNNLHTKTVLLDVKDVEGVENIDINKEEEHSQNAESVNLTEIDQRSQSCCTSSNISPEKTEITSKRITILAVDKIRNNLERNYAIDVFHIAVKDSKIPIEYVEHLFIVTGRSTRHIKAMAEALKLEYKKTAATL